MAGPLDGSRRHDDIQWNRNTGHAGLWAESDDEEEPALYRTDQFRIQVMKVMKCSKKYCHDWTRCPFAHPGEKATRRDPMLGIYTGIACPDMKKDQRCPRGHYCPYAHNVFEYWLHPTRYRTALCRDVERCTRKICFFAHEISEIRANVERPYVSPEQLVAASELAAADPRVQAEYNAAAAEPRRGNKPGLMTGMFNTLEDPPEYDNTQEHLQGLNLSLQTPRASEESQEVMQTLESLMRGDMGPITNPYTAANLAAAGSGNYRTLASGAGTLEAPPGGVPGLGGLPPLDQRIRRIASDPTSRHNPRGTAPYRQQEADLLRHTSIAQSVNTIDEMTPMMFPNHLNTMVQTASHQSRASQQNLANAAAHLLMDPKEPSIWSTPVSPLDNLYSTASTCSDRQSMTESQGVGALETAYHQKLKKRIAMRDGKEAAAAGYHNGGLGAPGMYGLHSGPRDGVLQSMPAAYANWSLNPNLEFAMAIQQRQQQQQQAYLHSLHEMRYQQQAYEQEMRSKLQQAIQNELRSQQGTPRMAPAKSPLPGVETGFDLRFGGLGENQGLLSQPPPEWSAARHPSLLHTSAAFFSGSAASQPEFLAPESSLPGLTAASDEPGRVTSSGLGGGYMMSHQGATNPNPASVGASLSLLSLASTSEPAPSTPSATKPNA